MGNVCEMRKEEEGELIVTRGEECCEGAASQDPAGSLRCQHAARCVPTEAAVIWVACLTGPAGHTEARLSDSS